LTPVFWDLMRMDSPKHAEARRAVSQKQKSIYSAVVYKRYSLRLELITFYQAPI